MAADRSGRARLIGDLIKPLLRRKRFYEKGRYRGVVRAWGAAVGDEVVGRTHICDFKQGVLTVDVDSAALLHELNGFHKPMLLRKLRDHRGGRDVEELRFRLGRQCADRARGEGDG